MLFSSVEGMQPPAERSRSAVEASGLVSYDLAIESRKAVEPMLRP